MRKRLCLFLYFCLIFLFAVPGFADSGYTVTMAEDTTVAKGETVAVPVTVESSSVGSFNALDMVITYDTVKLELTTGSLPGFSLTKDRGKIRILGYGQDRRCGSVAFTLTFKALATGRTQVKLTSAKVDSANHAISADAPQAVLSDDTTQITIGLPSDSSFPGEAHIPGGGPGGSGDAGGSGGYGRRTAAGEPAEIDGLWLLPYVEMDGRTVFLAAVAGNPGNGMTYAFDGEPMYSTEKYNGRNTAIGERVYVALFIAGPGEAVVQSETAARITAVKGTPAVLAFTEDVNASGKADLTDAVLVYDIYKGSFGDFSELSVDRFLNGDINLDGRINVADAAALADIGLQR